MRTRFRFVGLLPVLAVCVTESLAVIAPTEGRFDDLYHRDRWGDGTFAGFVIAPELYRTLQPYEGQYVRIHVRKAVQRVNPGPATLYKVWSIKRVTPPEPYLRLDAKTEPSSLSPSAPFSIDIRLTNTTSNTITVASEGARIRITGEGRDPMEINRHWTNLWQSYALYPSHTGVTLIATFGSLNWKDGVVNSPTGGTMHDVRLPPGDSTRLSLPMTAGLPVGKYEVNIVAVAYPAGNRGNARLSRIWLTFDIEETAANTPSDRTR